MPTKQRREGEGRRISRWILRLPVVCQLSPKSRSSCSPLGISRLHYMPPRRHRIISFVPITIISNSNSSTHPGPCSLTPSTAKLSLRRSCTPPPSNYVNLFCLSPVWLPVSVTVTKPHQGVVVVHYVGGTEESNLNWLRMITSPQGGYSSVGSFVCLGLSIAPQSSTPSQLRSRRRRGFLIRKETTKCSHN